MAITQEQFEKLLESKPQWGQWMLDSIHKGLADYRNLDHYSAFVRTAHNATAKAINRNCQILYHARQALFDLSDIRECSQGNRPFFIMGDQVRLSYKLLDEKLRPKNIPTQQTNDFMDQCLHVPEAIRQAFIPDLVLPEELSNLVVGYRFTGDGDIESSYEIYVVCPRGDSNDWKWRIYGRADVVELFPAAVIVPVSSAVEHTIVKKRVRVRKKEEAQETDEQSTTSEQSEQGG